MHGPAYREQMDAASPGRRARVRRVHECAIRIEHDVCVEARAGWLFQGLSYETTNDVLRICSHGSAEPFTTDLDGEDMYKFCTPCNAMPFETEYGEKLQVSYSTAPLTSPFRHYLLGPDDVALAEKHVTPQYGPVYVFKAEGDGDAMRMLPIHSDVDTILDALRTLSKFGP